MNTTGKDDRLKTPDISECKAADIDGMFAVINDSATAYKGHIPNDVWHDPYMPVDELLREIADGVRFVKISDDNSIIGIMGIQNVREVCLIRHAYVATNYRGFGIGSRLLEHLMKIADKPILIGTWKAATWAISFYEKHGFVPAPDREKDELLRKYWKISDRQIETSVVLKGPSSLKTN